MRTLSFFCAILALLAYSVSGLLHFSHLPHDHLLVGPVTAEQLRAHEATEEQDMQDWGAVSEAASRSGSLSVTPTGGLILPVSPELTGLVLALQLEIGLQLTVMLLVPLIYLTLLIIRPVSIRIESSPPEPPPRALAASG